MKNRYQSSLLKKFLFVIPEVFIGNPVFFKTKDPRLRPSRAGFWIPAFAGMTAKAISSIHLQETQRKVSSLFFVLCTTFMFSLGAASSWAIPDYAEKTKQGCKICHIKDQGGDLSNTGIKYAASGYLWPPSGGYRVLGPIRKSVRFLIGALHIVAAFLWFGTILYVHIILRPGYAARGLPKSEVALGLVSMAIVGVTGLLLTISKIRSLSVLYESIWGTMLSIKIFFYCVMVLTAFFVVLFIGPKLKRGGKKLNHRQGVFLTP